MVVIEDDSRRLETVCSPLQVRLARAAELARLGQLGDDRVRVPPPLPARLTRPLANHPPRSTTRRDRHPGGGQRNFPVVRGCRLRAVLQGFGCATPPLSIPIRVPIDAPRGSRAPSGIVLLPDLTSPRPRPAALPPGQRPDAGSDGLDAVSFVQRASVVSDPRGAFQHVAIFKNIVVAADGDDSARLHIFDVRDWSEKQVIRVGKVSEEVTVVPRLARVSPATVSALSFDGTTSRWAPEAALRGASPNTRHRGYVRLLQPLKVDAGPITKLHVSGDAFSPRTAPRNALVAWELDTKTSRRSTPTAARAFAPSTHRELRLRHRVRPRARPGTRTADWRAD